MISPDNNEILLACQENHFVMNRAAKALGLSARALRSIIESDVELAEMLQEAKDERIDVAEKVLAELVIDKNFNAVKLTLERLGASRGFQPSLSVDVKSNEQSAILAAIERKHIQDL